MPTATRCLLALLVGGTSAHAASSGSVVRFSQESGLYDEPFALKLAGDRPDLVIRFTADATVPTVRATSFAEAIPIRSTTVIRAAAFRGEEIAGPIETRTFIFPTDVARQPAQPPGLPSTWERRFAGDYGLDASVVDSTLPGYGLKDALRSLPCVSIVTVPENLFGPSGIYERSGQRGREWERAASIELVFPSGQRGFRVNAGIRMHGNSSRAHFSTLKHSIRIIFRRAYGPKTLRFPLFVRPGGSKYTQLILRASSTDSWTTKDGRTNRGVERYHSRRATYLRDQWMRDTHAEMGHLAARGRYVHLFLNGLYWGLYNLSERPDSAFLAEHLGGRRGDFDIVKDFVELEAGDLDAWTTMIDLATSGLSSDVAYFRIQGRDERGRRDPRLPVYLDVAHLIDYVLLHVYAGAEDWPHHNWWAARRRGDDSEGFRFLVWDQEITNDSLERVYSYARPSGQFRIEQPYPKPSPTFLFGRLLGNDRFRRRVIDRVEELLRPGGTLSPERNRRRWNRRVAEIDRAIVAESARWGDARRKPAYRREVEWLRELAWVDAYWNAVVPMATGRFKRLGVWPDVRAPVARLDDSVEERLVLTVPAHSDLVLIGGTSPHRVLTPTDGDLAARWRDPGFAAGNEWRAGRGGVGYERTSGYEKWIGTDLDEIGNGESNTSVYVRFPFVLSSKEAVAGVERWILRARYDDGFVAFLNGHAIASANAPPIDELSWSSAATSATEASPFSPVEFSSRDWGRYLRRGANVLAVHALNRKAASSDLLIRAEFLGRRTIEDQNATIFYTTDGTDPSSSQANRYRRPMTVRPGTTVQFRSIREGDWSARGTWRFPERSSKG